MNKFYIFLLCGALLLAPVQSKVVAAQGTAAEPAHNESGHEHEHSAQDIEKQSDHQDHTDDQHTGQEHARTAEGSEHADHDEASGHGGHDEHEEPELNLSPELLHEFGGKTATADAGVIRQQVSLPGEVKLNEEALAHITPRFPAKITKVRAKTGDRVKAGEVLAVAESSETLSRFELKSLIDGVIIKRHVTLGEHLSPDNTAFVVADLSTLWVDIALYPKQVPLVKVGQQARIITSHGPEPVEVHIDYVAPIVEEGTRTGLARIFLPNESNEWKPGMFVEGQITLGEYSADVVVPRSAVVDLEGQRVIFVQHDDSWEPRPVTLGRKDSDSVEVKQGLEAGEQYVAEGGFVLKAHLQKSEFESGHNH